MSAGGAELSQHLDEHKDPTGVDEGEAGHVHDQVSVPIVLDQVTECITQPR